MLTRDPRQLDLLGTIVPAAVGKGYFVDEDRSASFVELFFDLVFVFGITQVVASIHGHLDWPTLWRAAVILALLWWAWTQYTWIAGYADFDELQPRLVLLLATAGTFVLSVAVQGAWADEGSVFGMAYFGVMLLGGLFMVLRARANEMAGRAGQLEATIAYVLRMMAGSVLVLVGGFVPDDLRPWFWVGAVVVNLFSALAAGEYEYDVDASHFSERHGLFVIIVLGEALIAIGIGVVGQAGSLAFYVAGTAMLVTALAMWWSYFDWLFLVGERALKEVTGRERSRLARDAYSLVHYPIVAGVILFAVGSEALLAHPDLALDGGSRWAFVGGLMLFLASESVMAYRLRRALTWERYALIGMLAITGLTLGDLNGAALAALVVVVFVGTLGVETARHREALRQLR
ncbi:MAG: low temperature requirement protein A [Acidimicrobiia bacterium]|nr:low temperature requirement protein A [Acidimicrobiia bacterium]